MKITVSNTSLLRKLKEYGSKYDEDVLIEKATISKHLVKILSPKQDERDVQLSETATSKASSSSTTTPDQTISGDQQHKSASMQNSALSSENSKSIAPQPTIELTGSGIHFVIDNFDLRQEVRDMTAENQNKDFHWTNINCIKNRVSGAHLPNDKPICKLSDLPNGSVLPNAKDHVKNRDNYVVLVQRIMVEHIPALNFLTGAVQKHIPHMYSKEMAQSSTKVILNTHTT